MYNIEQMIEDGPMEINEDWGETGASNHHRSYQNKPQNPSCSKPSAHSKHGRSANISVNGDNYNRAMTNSTSTSTTICNKNTSSGLCRQPPKLNVHNEPQFDTRKMEMMESYHHLQSSYKPVKQPAMPQGIAGYRQSTPTQQKSCGHAKLSNELYKASQKVDIHNVPESHTRKMDMMESSYHAESSCKAVKQPALSQGIASYHQSTPTEPTARSHAKPTEDSDPDVGIIALATAAVAAPILGAVAAGVGRLVVDKAQQAAAKRNAQKAENSRQAQEMARALAQAQLNRNGKIKKTRESFSRMG